MVARNAIINMEKYPFLERFSKSISIPSEDLVEAFEIENTFHEKILAENSKEERIKLYNELYSTVHPIYQRKNAGNHNNGEIRSRKAFLFKKELKNKSILEVGCGQGAFLKTISKNFQSKKLMGLDVSIPTEAVIKQYPEIDFVSVDITEFDLPQKFEVVYSNHVLEHMATADLHTHIASIKNVLADKGTLIINMPNRLFGPSDVTRIIDFSYTNKIGAKGSHFNELTYTELIEILKTYGFSNFRTVLPHTKLRHLFKWLRINPEILCKVENSKSFVKFLHSLKYKGTCVAKFEITLICQKNN